MIRRRICNSVHWPGPAPAGAAASMLGAAGHMVSHRCMAYDDPRDDDDVTQAPLDEDAEDRSAILRRRAMFIASAIAGLNLASCGGEVTGPQPCLDAPPPTGVGGYEPCLSAGGYEPCLGMPGSGGTPRSCLTTTPTDYYTGGGGAGGEGGATGGSSAAGGAGGEGGRPRPCLDMAPPPPKD